jgi:hypothetical protein
MTSNGPYINILENIMIQVIIISIPFQKNNEKHMLCNKIKIEIDRNHNESLKTICEDMKDIKRRVIYNLLIDLQTIHQTHS